MTKRWENLVLIIWTCISCIFQLVSKRLLLELLAWRTQFKQVQCRQMTKLEFIKGGIWTFHVETIVYLAYRMLVNMPTTTSSLFPKMKKLLKFCLTMLIILQLGRPWKNLLKKEKLNLSVSHTSGKSYDRGPYFLDQKFWPARDRPETDINFKVFRTSIMFKWKDW